MFFKANRCGQWALEHKHSCSSARYSGWDGKRSERRWWLRSADQYGVFPSTLFFQADIRFSCQVSCFHRYPRRAYRHVERFPLGYVHSTKEWFSYIFHLFEVSSPRTESYAHHVQSRTTLKSHSRRQYRKDNKVRIRSLGGFRRPDQLSLYGFAFFQSIPSNTSCCITRNARNNQSFAQLIKSKFMNRVPFVGI